MTLPEPLERLISLFKELPGVGAKSARRMAFFVLQQPQSYAKDMADALNALKRDVATCSRCGNLTVTQPCPICSDPMRNRHLLCVVESLEDLTSIELSGLFNGLYFNLATSVSPMDDRENIPPDVIERLRALIAQEPIEEIIIATNPRVEGDMTFYALLDALADLPVTKSRLAYGRPVGGSIEFADRVTLHAALESRRPVTGD